MKSLAAYILIFHVLLSAWVPGGLAEVFRIPALNDHYAQHYAESNGTMGWGEFLSLHFANPEHERKDSSRHGALPFHGPSMAIHMFLPPTGSPVVIPSPVVPSMPPACQVAEVGEWPGRSVFHPPKSVG
ncbi:MAG: hypothetical protein IPG92_01745 [Flavobacteriales bacterium]|nr:hypothetical protein [Flavobacteriales bacterium]